MSLLNDYLTITKLKRIYETNNTLAGHCKNI